VRDFIDARRCTVGQCSAANATATQGFVLLQYVNQRARLRGWDVSARRRLLSDETLGDANAALVVSQVQGDNLSTGDRLHNIMPLNARLALQHQLGGWSTTAEWVAVAGKRRVSQVRNEVPTPGYALLNLRVEHDWDALHLTLGIDNLFNRAHTPPLGGAYVGQGPSMTTAGIPWGVLVPGPGRSFSASFQYRY